MIMIKIYTTHCPKCDILEKILIKENINYETEEDVEKIIALGVEDVPQLEVNGEIMNFSKAIKWIKENKNG